jgi:hypothetical protein
LLEVFAIGFLGLDHKIRHPIVTEVFIKPGFCVDRQSRCDNVFFKRKRRVSVPRDDFPGKKSIFNKGANTMDAILVEYDVEKETLEILKGAVVEDWVKVCNRFNDDVHRLRDVDDLGLYNALYECFDEKDKKQYYVVREDAALFKMRRKNFLSKIGK